jgi:MSHA biogenesis protein MshN
VSVINKMLRDLDARRNEGRGASLPADMLGTSSVQGLAGIAPQHRRPLWWVLLLSLLAGAGLAYWVLMPAQPVVPPPLAAMPQPVAAVLPLENTAPVPAPESTVSAPVPVEGDTVAEPPSPVVAEPEAPAPRKKKRRSEAAMAEDAPSTTRRERPRKPAPTELSAASPAPAPAVVPPPAALTAPSPPPAAATAQRRQGAAQETLAQAQTLWNAGSREAGLELVREGVAAAERAQPSDPALLAQLVREQVRMELALGRPAAVLGVLTRLESALAGQADLWAVRGNAAQRLGRHEEAVQAYLAALQLRPDEPRWMLGAAVSLAAQGQLDAAARQAEQARALGPVSPEVLTYLRQAGVPLR